MTATSQVGPPALRTVGRPAARTAGRPAARRYLGRRVRTALLAAHVSVSVGWLGVEAVQVVLGLSALAAGDIRRVHATYLTMELVGTTLVPPVAVASLLTGLALAWGTKWTVLGHWWVVVKLAINVGLIITGHELFRTWLGAQAASAGVPQPQDPGTAPELLLVGLFTALALLISATVVSIYKPWGRTPFGYVTSNESHRRFSPDP